MKKIEQAARHVASMDFRTDTEQSGDPGEVPARSVSQAEDHVGRMGWMEYRIFCEEYAQTAIELKDSEGTQ